MVRDVDATYRFVVPGTPERRRGKPPVPDAAPAPRPSADAARAVHRRRHARVAGVRRRCR